jgi:four helix bundle protein
MTNDLKERTKRFALDVLCYCSVLPAKPEFRVISSQLMRAGTSVGANYRAACRSKSKADFINKLSIVEEEADESEYWFELLENLSSANNPELLRLKNEASQLVAIMVQSKKTARSLDKPIKVERLPDSPFEIRNSKFS